jgi:hypothetical protein
LRNNVRGKRLYRHVEREASISSGGLLQLLSNKGCRATTVLCKMSWDAASEALGWFGGKGRGVSKIKTSRREERDKGPLPVRDAGKWTSKWGQNPRLTAEVDQCCEVWCRCEPGYPPRQQPAPKRRPRPCRASAGHRGPHVLARECRQCHHCHAGPSPPTSGSRPGLPRPCEWYPEPGSGSRGVGTTIEPHGQEVASETLNHAHSGALAVAFCPVVCDCRCSCWNDADTTLCRTNCDRARFHAFFPPRTRAGL